MNVFRTMLQCFQNSMLVLSKTMLKELWMGMMEIEIKNEIMAIQGTWKHKGSLEDNYKITGMILY